MAKWVRHISGQGEKYRVRDVEFNSLSLTVWCVDNPDYKDGIDRHLFIPRSQYKECEPPEEWEDVTDSCEVGRYGKDSGCLDGSIFISDESNHQMNALFVKDYRLRKIDGLHNGPAFIIERRKG